MEYPLDAQLNATHTTYGAMLAKLMLTLVERRVISAADAADVATYGQAMLAGCGITGSQIDASIEGLEALAAAFAG